jgi:hypothetical protein
MQHQEASGLGAPVEDHHFEYPTVSPIASPAHPASPSSWSLGGRRRLGGAVGRLEDDEEAVAGRRQR